MAKKVYKPTRISTTETDETTETGEEGTRINPVPNKPALPAHLKIDPIYDGLAEKYKKLINATDTFDLELAKMLFAYRDIMRDKNIKAEPLRDMQLGLNRILKKALLSNRDDFNRRQELILMVIRDDLLSDDSVFGSIKIFNVTSVGRSLKVKDFILLLTFYRDVAPTINRSKVIQNRNLRLVADTITNLTARNQFLAYFGALAEY